MKKRTKNIPAILTSLAAGITLALYPVVAEAINPVVYAQVIAVSAIPWLLPYIARKRGLEITPLLNTLIIIHIVFSCFLGSAMGFYKRFPLWDLLMHGLFGLIGAVVMYAVLRTLFTNRTRIGFACVIGLCVMGLAALWEVFEYTADLILDGDAQRVKEALLAGLPPIKDTMTDIVITMVGLGVFYVIWWIGLVSGKHLQKR